MLKSVLDFFWFFFLIWIVFFFILEVHCFRFASVFLPSKTAISHRLLCRHILATAKPRWSRHIAFIILYEVLIRLEYPFIVSVVFHILLLNLFAVNTGSDLVHISLMFAHLHAGALSTEDSAAQPAMMLTVPHCEFSRALLAVSYVFIRHPAFNLAIL